MYSGLFKSMYKTLLLPPSPSYSLKLYSLCPFGPPPSRRHFSPGTTLWCRPATGLRFDFSCTVASPAALYIVLWHCSNRRPVVRPSLTESHRCTADKPPPLSTLLKDARPCDTAPSLTTAHRRSLCWADTPPEHPLALYRIEFRCTTAALPPLFKL